MATSGNLAWLRVEARFGRGVASRHPRGIQGQRDACPVTFDQIEGAVAGSEEIRALMGLQPSGRPDSAIHADRVDRTPCHTPFEMEVGAG